MSAYERALAPKLLRKMIDGTWDAIQCCREIPYADMIFHNCALSVNTLII